MYLSRKCCRMARSGGVRRFEWLQCPGLLETGEAHTVSYLGTEKLLEVLRVTHCCHRAQVLNLGMYQFHTTMMDDLHLNYIL